MFLNITIQNHKFDQPVSREEQTVRFGLYGNILPQQKAGVPSSTGSEGKEWLIEVFGDDDNDGTNLWLKFALWEAVNLDFVLLQLDQNLATIKGF